MKINQVDTALKVFIIAEIGNNHEGSVKTACEMVEAAAASGADAVKFQTFNTEHYVSFKDKDRFEMLKSFELSPADYKELKELAKEKELAFISTPFDVQSALFLNDYVPAFKISSSDNTFYPLIEQVARLEKPVIMSCGLSDIHQIDESKKRIEKVWKEIGYNGDIGLLHCVTSYPVPDEEAGLGALKVLKDRFDCTIGYSDHTMDTEAAVLSVAMGARIIEKHFTLDKNYSEFRDHSLSAEPAEFKSMVERIRRAEMLIGEPVVTLQNCEKSIIGAVRRTIVSSRELRKGDVLSMSDITWVRPAGGLSPGQEANLIGKRLCIDVPKGEPIRLDMFEQGG